MAGAALGSWEVFWREQGFGSGYRDDGALWSFARGQVGSRGMWRSTIIGSSRAQVDLDPEILGAIFENVPPVMLAIDGAAPWPVLSDLIDETSYGGVVLLEVNPLHVFASAEEWDDTASGFLTHYHQLSWIGPLELDLRMAAREELVLLNPALEPQRLVRHALAGKVRMSSTPRSMLRLDRHLEIDYPSDARAFLSSQSEYYASHGMLLPVTSPLNTIMHFAECVRARGGELVLLRLPSSGQVRRAEHERFPREKFWDVVVEQSSLPAVHFEDYAELRRFDCPDGSHLNVRDAEEFSRLLRPILHRLISRQGVATNSTLGNEPGNR